MKTLSKKTVKIYWGHVRQYKLMIFLIALGSVIAATIDVIVPLWYKKLFDTLALHQRPDVGDLVSILFVILGLFFIEWVGHRFFAFSENYLDTRVISNLLNSSFKYLHDHSYSFFSNNFAGSLVRRVNRYAKSYEDISRILKENIFSLVLRVGLILVVLFWRNWLLGAGLLVWAVIYIALSYKFSIYKLKYTLKRAALDSETTGYLADTITNSLNLKLFSSEKNEYSGYSKLTERIFRLRLFTWNLDAYLDSVQGFMMIFLEFGIFYLAVRLYANGVLTIGDFALLQSYVLTVIIRLWDIGRHIRRIYESLADAEEMTEILTTPHEVQDKPGAGTLKVEAGTVNFLSLGFGYHKELAVFKNFNLSISPGERVALIGPSGGGKSTIVKLLLRFYNLKSGKILIDGQDISQVTQESLRNSIALVPQDPILFHRSLLDNIRYARPSASNEEVLAVAKMAHADEFIARLPQGYETFVGERGIKLSGGERQRVAIARAILKDAPILILDEATSSLDSESELFIQDALKKIMAGRTTIVIAHRLSTIMQMDRIVVIADGKIKEQGKHKELLKARKGIYQKLWEIQAGGFS